MNKKRYWLRGGLAIFVLYVFTTIILIPLGNPSGCSFICFPYWVMPTLYLDYLLSIPLNFIFPNVHVSESMIILGPSIFYFILGSFLGWIYGKIKNKNI